MWYLAACDDDGVCFGLLRKDKSVSENPDAEASELMTFKKKKQASKTVMQINLSYKLMPNGYQFRVVPIKM